MASHQHHAIPCPDPSAHQHDDKKLQNQASTAALYATAPGRSKQSQLQAQDILDKDQKLSSRSAAMSLKHAKPEDLPSFPSTGGLTASNSNSAALLAHGNQKPFEHWKPDPSADAGKAALLAKDYKPAPLWQPGLSAAGSKAALLAHKDAGKHEPWSPKATPEGSSAATQAFKNSTTTAAYEQSSDSKKKALLAATASVRRSRAESNPTPLPKSPSYPDEANASHNALNAATMAGRQPSFKAKDDYQFSSPALEQSRIKHLSDRISRDMFTEHPPVDIEVEEKKHQAALRASSISMAKAMYDLAQRREQEQISGPDAGHAAATNAVNRQSTGSQPDLRQQAMQYIHVQEAAQRLAQERLAKLDPDGAARFREHYGYPLRAPRQKLSIKNRYSRGRAQSAGARDLDSDSDDEFASRRIRNQMSQFNKNIESVDEKKRQTDRAALLAAAEKKVQAQMKGMDERVYAETGKVSPAMMEQWEAKAREKAAKDSAKRTENFGKTDIGGGRFMDQSEVEAIAAARLKPTLDEITENAERRRARDEEIRLDQEEKRRQELKEKENAREVKALMKQTKEAEKAAAKQEKAEQKAAAKQEKEQQKAAAKAEKEAEKTRKAEEKQAASEDKKRTEEAKQEAAAGAAISAAAHKEIQEKSEPKESTESTASPPQVVVDEPENELEREDSNDFQDARDGPLSPVLSRTENGDPILRATIERHISHIDYSESEDEGHREFDSEIDEAFDATAPVDTSTAVKPTSDVDDSAKVKAPVLIVDGNKSTTPVAATGDTTPKSPTSKSGFGKLMDKLKRRSRQPDADAGTSQQGTISRLRGRSHGEKDKDVDGVAAAAAKPKSTTDPTSPSIQPLSAVEAKAVADKHEAAAKASPSSFVRGTTKSKAGAADGAADDDVSDLSSLTSDGDEVGELTGLSAKGAGLETARAGSVELSRSPARETRFQEQL